MRRWRRQRDGDGSKQDVNRRESNRLIHATAVGLDGRLVLPSQLVRLIRTDEHVLRLRDHGNNENFSSLVSTGGKSDVIPLTTQQC